MCGRTPPAIGGCNVGRAGTHLPFAGCPRQVSLDRMLRGSSGEDQLSASMRRPRARPSCVQAGLAILAPRDAFKSPTDNPSQSDRVLVCSRSTTTQAHAKGRLPPGWRWSTGWPTTRNTELGRTRGRRRGYVQQKQSEADRVHDMGSKISDERDQKLLSSQAVSPGRTGREVSWMTCVRTPPIHLMRAACQRDGSFTPWTGTCSLPGGRSGTLPTSPSKTGRLVGWAVQSPSRPRFTASFVSSPRHIVKQALRDLSGFSGPGLFPSHRARCTLDGRTAVALEDSSHEHSTSEIRPVPCGTAKCRTRD
jgi:hypothetical protein